MSRFKEKVCLVTGGTKGIGLAIAMRFSQEGGTAVIVSRKRKNVEEAHSAIAKRGGRVVSYVGNFGSREERLRVREEIEKRFGRVDVLVANIAASVHSGKALSITEKAYDKIFDVNVKSTFFLIKEYHGLLCKAQGGEAAVLIVSSITGYQIDKSVPIYSMTKTALLGMTKLLAV